MKTCDELDRLRLALNMAERFIQQAREIHYQLEEQRLDKQDEDLNKFLYGKVSRYVL